MKPIAGPLKPSRGSPPPPQQRQRRPRYHTAISASSLRARSQPPAGVAQASASASEPASSAARPGLRQRVLVCVRRTFSPKTMAKVPKRWRARGGARPSRSGERSGSRHCRPVGYNA